MSYWVVIAPATDMDAVWVAHALDYDVISQGDGVREALDAVREAVKIVVEDDRKRGADPSLRRAPYQFWEDMFNWLPDADGPHADPRSGSRFFVCVADGGRHLYWTSSVRRCECRDAYGQEGRRLGELHCRRDAGYLVRRRGKVIAVCVNCILAGDTDRRRLNGERL